MRVKISYGMEIEDIPEHCESLGLKAHAELKEACESLMLAVDNITQSGQDFTVVLNMLEKVRLKLTKSDLVITDLTAILNGLQKFHNGEEHVSERRPIMDPSRDPTASPKDSGQG